MKPLTQHGSPQIDELMARATANTDKLRGLVAQLGGAPVSPLDFNGHVPSLPDPAAKRAADAIATLEQLGYVWCFACGWVPATADGTGCVHGDQS